MSFKNYIIRIVFWFTLAISFYFIKSSALIKIQYRNEPELAKIKVNISEHPGEQKYLDDLDNYYTTLDSIFMETQTQEMLKKVRH